MSNSLVPDQARRFVEGLIWVQAVCKSYQHMALVGIEISACQTICSLPVWQPLSISEN